MSQAVTPKREPWDPGHSTLLDHMEPAGGPCVRRGKLHCKGPGPHAAPAEGDHFASHRAGRAWTARAHIGLSTGTGGGCIACAAGGCCAWSPCRHGPGAGWLAV